MPESRNNREQRFKGLPVSGGKVVAPVCLFRDQGRHPSLRIHHVPPDEVPHEQERLSRALEIVRGRLEAVERAVADRIGPAEAEIFVAQRMILDDTALRERIQAAIDDQNYNAEAAATKVLDGYESRLREVDHDYLQERATDIAELKRRVLDALLNTQPEFLCEVEGHCRRGRDRIVVTEELTPSLAIGLDTHAVRGLVTEHGGVTSHAAILARAIGVPAVTGIPDVGSTVSCGSEILVDGDRGEVVVWPDPETVERARSEPPGAHPEAVPPVEGLAVMANIAMASEVAQARDLQAEGIGLYRTELEFLAAGRLLSEEEQAERYTGVVEAMEGRPVTLRLIDAGGDKPTPLFGVGEEESPQLGLRGARFLLERTDLLQTQARAIARASRAGPVHIMYPMVVEADQFARLRRQVEEAVEDVPHGELYHGAMFEVPSACMDAERILKISDFASIGTNDLIQYLFAVDRNNERVAYDYFPDRKVFWKVVSDVASAAREAGKPLSICGEMAADSEYVPRLIELGIETVSVSVRLIPGVRRAAAEALSEGSRA